MRTAFHWPTWRDTKQQLNTDAKTAKNAMGKWLKEKQRAQTFKWFSIFTVFRLHFAGEEKRKCVSKVFSRHTLRPRRIFGIRTLSVVIGSGCSFRFISRSKESNRLTSAVTVMATDVHFISVLSFHKTTVNCYRKATTHLSYHRQMAWILSLSVALGLSHFSFGSNPENGWPTFSEIVSGKLNWTLADVFSFCPLEICS